MAEKKIDPNSRAIIFVPTETEKEMVHNKKELRRQLEQVKQLSNELENKLKDLDKKSNS